MKYEILRDDVREVGVLKTKVYRIKNIATGELGGYVESESNLSQEGSCWVYGNAVVYGEAKVYGDAIVRDDARVCDRAEVYGHAEISGLAIVCGRAEVYDAKVRDRSVVYNRAVVNGGSDISGDSQVSEGTITGSRLVRCSVAIYGLLKDVHAEGAVINGTGFAKSIGD